MAKSKQQKTDIVNQYKDILTKSGTILVFQPNGISANEASTLKKELFDHDANFNVVKNTLFKVALKESNLPEVATFNGGENAVVFCTEETVTETAKILKDFLKETKKGEIASGILTGDVLTKEQVTNLADLPSKDQLLGQLLNVMNGPIRGLATVLNGNIRDFVQVINAIKDTKSE